MRVKYGGRTINVENQSNHPSKEFYADWNGYAIQIQKEKVHNGHAWHVQLTTPREGVSAPEGYEKYSTLDIKIVHDAILYTACQGCG